MSGVEQSVYHGVILDLTHRTPSTDDNREMPRKAPEKVMQMLLTLSTED